MLQIQNISKTYKTCDIVQRALDNVNLNLRDNEFVAVLGPSGSGKTTLLNIIGGLDRYDSGDLVINGISTKKYRDRDWDSYRNHTIGFVFQSYNLIPHQSVLANVELALTISGIGRAERRKRAKEALERVGLGNQLHKRPNQLSGGQMQRVAIARALVNEPDILLADEPTGALDSETSVQVMELLKEVARDKLVVMVTHNPELAEKYATRIVRLRDGKITDDSDPYVVDEAALAPPKHKNMGRSSMSVLTSLALSFNNLRTKMGRTLLTSFAGSIGIIGIALILSLSTGVNTYISDIQKETMTSYPVTIEAQTVDLSSLLAGSTFSGSAKEAGHALDGVYANTLDVETASAFTSSLTENNLTAFKKYLDNPGSEIYQYVGENGVTYGYDVKFNVFTRDPDGELVTTNGVTIGGANQAMISGMSSMAASTTMSNIMSSGNFSQLLPGRDGALVSDAILDSYDLLYGSWPENYDEIVLIVDRNNEIRQTTLYELGLLPSSVYTAMMKSLMAGEELETTASRWSYADACKQTYYLLPACDQYVENEDGTYRYAAGTAAGVESLLDKAIALKVVGVVRPQSDQSANYVMNPIGYTQALTDYLVAHTDASDVVTAQRENETVNILTGLEFAPADDATKAADAAEYFAGLTISEKAALCGEMMQSMQQPSAGEMSETQLAAAFDQFLQTADTATLVALYDANVSNGSYDENMQAFGVVSLDAPSSINIYTDSFEAKDGVSECIERYNESASEADQISYTDYVGLLMSSVTTIVNVISYVLIAFVAVSLIVSSIMIGIITYISVLERTKEIGILRAIGASRRNISQVFNAETFIIGLCSGVIGIGVTLLLLLPGNTIIHHLTGTTSVNAILPTTGAIILIVLSVVLTLIGGLIPSKKAAKKDPVTALRTE